MKKHKTNPNVPVVFITPYEHQYINYYNFSQLLVQTFCHGFKQNVI